MRLHYRIRIMRVEEYPQLRRFLYEAIFQRGKDPQLPEEITDEPQLAMYHSNFGRQHDRCFVADLHEIIIGAVWVRILPKGFGYVDNETPELAIAVRKKFRGKGVGEALMISMLSELASAGYGQVSLSVQKDNPAIRLYRRHQFVTVSESDEDLIMVRRW